MFGTVKIVTWECHVDDSSEVRYDVILSRDILTLLGLNLKSSNMPLGEVTDRLKVAHHIWSIWAHMSLKF